VATTAAQPRPPYPPKAKARFWLFLNKSNNPKGIASFSPGLAQSACPGWNHHRPANSERVGSSKPSDRFWPAAGEGIQLFQSWFVMGTGPRVALRATLGWNMAILSGWFTIGCYGWCAKFQCFYQAI